MDDHRGRLLAELAAIEEWDRKFGPATIATAGARGGRGARKLLRGWNANPSITLNDVKIVRTAGYF
ncbi:MAG TPA: hypothetical protein VEV41_21300 [Terriglobales bacterium]|nr:hypothetical protein [Terriglobales bacterium]